MNFYGLKETKKNIKQNFLECEIKLLKIIFDKIKKIVIQNEKCFNFFLFQRDQCASNSKQNPITF